MHGPCRVNQGLNTKKNCSVLDEKIFFETATNTTFSAFLAHFGPENSQVFSARTPRRGHQGRKRRKKIAKNALFVTKPQFFSLVSKTVVSSKTGQFLRFFFRFRPWCLLLGMLKRLGCFQARNGPKMLKRWKFPVLGAILGEPPANEI